MRTRNSSYPNNSPITIPKRRNRRRAPNVVEPELRTIVEVAPMADNRTMEELLQSPTKGYGEAIVIPEINADHFEIKTNLLQLVQVNPFHGFEREHVLSFDAIIVDSGCSKHMTGNLKLLRNFIEKFMGIVRFGNDNFAAITGYGNYVQGDLTISHVYYMEGLRHNLFSVGQFCDRDLEVAFRSNTYYIRNLEGGDLLTGYRDSNLYIISISEMATLSLVCSRDLRTTKSTYVLLVNKERAKRTRKIIETIHVKFDELMAMASECINSGPEYYTPRTQEVIDYSAANTLDNENTPSSSSIIIEDNDASQIVTSSKEQIKQEPLTPLVNEYDLRVGRKRYALDYVWEKCEKFHDTAYPWHDEGFEEEEQWESGIEKTDYNPPFVKSETFEVKDTLSSLKELRLTSKVSLLTNGGS
ncbi:hypothetical protein Tco_0441922 [Tanacetum coccineum]